MKSSYQNCIVSLWSGFEIGNGKSEKKIEQKIWIAKYATKCIVSWNSKLNTLNIALDFALNGTNFN